MTLAEQLTEDMKTAMRQKDAQRLQTIRLLRAALLEKEVAERVGGTSSLSEIQVVEVLQKQAKQRKDSITQYENANRPDLAEIEKIELAIIETYLPQMMSAAEIDVVVQEIINTTGATTPQEMGKVMGPAMAALKGKADGKMVQESVKKLLNT
jgi:uncharacterized protein